MYDPLDAQQTAVETNIIRAQAVGKRNYEEEVLIEFGDGDVNVSVLVISRGRK